MSNKDFDFEYDNEQNSSKNNIDETITKHTQNNANLSLELQEPLEAIEPPGDYNRIRINISDRKTPIIVLWGPTSIGKSLVMIRLSRYLKSQKYEVVPVTDFRTHDPYYKDKCKDFNKFLNRNIAPVGTGTVDFMLLLVKRGASKICQILEAPGEHYYDSKHPERPFPHYINEVIHRNNPKIYIFFLEIDWYYDQNTDPQTDREQYAVKISGFLGLIKPSDSIILLCNKGDKQSNYLYKGKPEEKRYKSDIKDLFPNIFNNLDYRKFNLFGSNNHRYDFVVFSSGSFNKTADGTETIYVEGDDIYPKNLWKVILGNIKGRWL